MNKLALIIIALSLSITQFYFAKYQCLRDNESGLWPKLKTFTGFSYGVEAYQEILAPAHKNRFFSGFLSSWYCNFFKEKDDSIKGSKFINAFSSYHAIWMFLTLLLCIFTVRNPFPWIVALFAGSMIAWVPAARGLLYPYDGPILFFWTLLVIVGMSPDWRYWLPLLTGIAIGFKETAALCCLIPFLWFDLPLKDRFKWAAYCGIAVIWIKIVISFISGTLPFFSLPTHAVNTANCPSNISVNIHALLHLFPAHPIFAAGGLVAALFFLPNKRVIVGWKIIALLFICNMMIFGQITEYRVWHELIPVFLWCWDNSTRTSTV